MKRIPLLDIDAQLKPIREEVISAVTEVIDSKQYILGKRVQELEDKIARYSGSHHAIGVSSGTDALLIALMALGVGKGDLVITTPYSFFATAGVIARLGAAAVFADIDPVLYSIDPANIEEWLKKRPADTIKRVKAIIPVHLYGQCADMKDIMDVAGNYNIPVIEDAAQAIGAEYPFDGSIKRAGSIGLMGCFSFFPSKNLGGIGDGGMVITSDEVLAEKLKILRVHGANPKYYHRMIGGNFRLDTVQAAVLLVKFKYLDGWHESRQTNAIRYDESFRKANIPDSMINTPSPLYRGSVRHYHIYNQYVIRAARRNELRTFLENNGIGTEIYYPVPFHLQECFTYLGYRKGDFPYSEKAADETLALPVYPEITEDMQMYVVDKVKEFYSMG
ncbi:MAG: transcriptional regulator [Deltaproteobacteria bacterium GWC2_42_11]|nr:MAG: transcriptional regulator [Deltaproteobacteria bacterium GWC2_42_11]HBO83527.1 transcriptional regulator [Deltaproteobacteria bacterium]